MPQLQGHTPIDLTQFGGLCTLLDATNLPIYLSPDCKNCEFLPGLVRTRPGLSSQFSLLTGLPSVNYLKTYITQLIQARLLVLDSLGNLYKENPQGTLTKFATIEMPGDFCNSVSLFAREYMAFGDNLFGNAIPRQYDDSNFDRVSQVGPGAPPNVTANSAGVDISTITQPAAVVNSSTDFPIRGLVWSDSPSTSGVGNVITIYYTPAINPMDPNIYVGANIVISNFFKGNVAYPNGVWKINSIQDAVIGGVLYHTFSYIGPANDHVVNNVPAGASYQATLATIETTTPNISITPGSTVAISGSSVPAWNIDWKIDSVPASCVMNIIDTALASDVATYTFTLQPNPATGLPYAPPSPGQIVTVTGTTNGGGVFNVNLANITSVSGSTFTVALPSPDVLISADSGIAQVSGTVFTIDPVEVPALAGAPILGNSSGGTLTGSGTMVPGPRQVAVSFLTRNNYITKPSPPFNFNLNSTNSITISQIPIGPPNVVARILMFTPLLDATATLGSFFTIEPQMIVNDNSTTSVSLTFTDTALLQGTSQDYLFELNELGEAASVTEYNSRLFWSGVRNYLQNFDNLTFDGGFDPTGTYPLGWMPDSLYGSGGFQVSDQAKVIFGNAYGISGDGTNAIRGMISQNAFADEFLARRFIENTSYSVRVHLKKDAGMVSGNVKIDVFSPSTSSVLGTFSVSQSAILSSGYSEFIGPLLSSIPSIPSDVVIRLYADGTPTIGHTFYVENIEFFDTLNPYLTTSLWASGFELPENYTGTTLISVAPENGQMVRSSFRIRNYLYIAKERSLYITADDGQNDPSQWDVNEVSSQVGTPSPSGIGLGDEWVVIASQSGLYYFDGGAINEQNKLSKEIQPTWDRINWVVGQKIVVKVDVTRKRVYIAVPMDDSTITNKMLVMDYVEGFGDPLGDPSGRRWTIWDISCNAMNFVLRADTGHQPFFIGNNTGTGKIYELDEEALNDDGVAIDSYWQSGFFQQNTRMNFGYLMANIIGEGICNLILRSGNQQYLRQIRGWQLNPTSFSNMERQIQIDSSRMAVRFGTHGLQDFFSLQGASLFVQPSMWSPARGTNSAT